MVVAAFVLVVSSTRSGKQVRVLYHDTNYDFFFLNPPKSLFITAYTTILYYFGENFESFLQVLVPGMF